MTFSIQVKVDTSDRNIKNECIEVLSKLLNKKGYYFGVGYNPNELDIDSLAKA